MSLVDLGDESRKPNFEDHSSKYYQIMLKGMVDHWLSLANFNFLILDL
jgi:hypothetical protein